MPGLSPAGIIPCPSESYAPLSYTCARTQHLQLPHAFLRSRKSMAMGPLLLPSPSRLSPPVTHAYPPLCNLFLAGTLLHPFSHDIPTSLCLLPPSLSLHFENTTDRRLLPPINYIYNHSAGIVSNPPLIPFSTHSPSSLVTSSWSRLYHCRSFVAPRLDLRPASIIRQPLVG